jgi:hypothetical protein
MRKLFQSRQPFRESRPASVLISVPCQHHTTSGGLHAFQIMPRRMAKRNNYRTDEWSLMKLSTPHYGTLASVSE